MNKRQVLIGASALTCWPRAGDLARPYSKPLAMARLNSLSAKQEHRNPLYSMQSRDGNPHALSMMAAMLRQLIYVP